MKASDYWAECLSDAFEERGIKVGDNDLKYIAEAIAGAHECYGMAFYQPESPYPSEIKRLEQKLKAEREKVVCRTCNGHGSITTHFGTMQSTSSCWKCHGEGRHAP